MDIEILVDKSFKAIKDLEDINSAQVKNINRMLKAVEHTLGNLYERQSEANHRPLREEMIRVKGHGSELYIRCALRANTERLLCLSEHFTKRTITQQPPDIFPDVHLAQPPLTESSPNNTSPAHTEESILNVGPLLVSQDFSSTSLLQLQLPLPSPPSGSSLPLDETHNTIPLPQVTLEMDTMLRSLRTINSSLESLDPNFSETTGIGSGLIPSGPSLYDNRLNYRTPSLVASWLTRRVEAGNAYLEVYLDCGERCARTLLKRVFTLHPLLIKVYLIAEPALLSLHIATLLLTCMLYIQEAILLATQTEPELPIA